MYIPTKFNKLKNNKNQEINSNILSSIFNQCIIDNGRLVTIIIALSPELQNFLIDNTISFIMYFNDSLYVSGQKIPGSQYRQTPTNYTCFSNNFKYYSNFYMLCGTSYLPLSPGIIKIKLFFQNNPDIFLEKSILIEAINGKLTYTILD